MNTLLNEELPADAAEKMLKQLKNKNKSRKIKVKNTLNQRNKI